MAGACALLARTTTGWPPQPGRGRVRTASLAPASACKPVFAIRRWAAVPHSPRFVTSAAALRHRCLRACQARVARAVLDAPPPPARPPPPPARCSTVGWCAPLLARRGCGAALFFSFLFSCSRGGWGVVPRQSRHLGIGARAASAAAAPRASVVVCRAPAVALETGCLRRARRWRWLAPSPCSSPRPPLPPPVALANGVGGGTFAVRRCHLRAPPLTAPHPH